MKNRFIVNEKAGNATVDLIGAFKTADAEVFGNYLMNVVKNNLKVIIDMKNTEYICSGILREVLACQAYIDDNDNKELLITNVNDEIMDVFEMTGFNNILTIE